MASRWCSTQTREKRSDAKIKQHEFDDSHRICTSRPSCHHARCERPSQNGKDSGSTLEDSSRCAAGARQLKQCSTDRVCRGRFEVSGWVARSPPAASEQPWVPAAATARAGGDTTADAGVWPQFWIPSDPLSSMSMDVVKRLLPVAKVRTEIHFGNLGRDGCLLSGIQTRSAQISRENGRHHNARAVLDVLRAGTRPQKWSRRLLWTTPKRGWPLPYRQAGHAIPDVCQNRTAAACRVY